MTLLLHVALVLAMGQQEEYFWPLDLPRVVTSSFAEYRGGRFHAGIDLRTGDIGKSVHAPAAGYVSRVRCSPWGYGKAVYVQFDDGNQVVFGHLSDFAPALRDFVRKEQHARKNYTVDLYPEPSQFRVSRGEIVAASGDTGIGPVHLHYELRDNKGRPINPRMLGITWPDTTTPKIRKILVMPDGPGSTVNGDIVPVVLEPRMVEPDRYVCDAVRATGRIGFGVDVIDPANSGENVLGVYSVRTAVDGKETFRVLFDRFSYEERQHESVSYHPYLLNKGRFLLQWRWPDNTCEPYQQCKSDGWYTVGKERAEVRIETADFLGNTAEVSFQIDPSESPRPPDVTRQGNGKGSVEIDCMGDWIMLTAKFTAPEPTAPRIELEGAAAAEFRRVDDKTFRAGVVPSAGAQRTAIKVTHERMKTFDRSFEVIERGKGDRTVMADDAASAGDSATGGAVKIKSNSPYGRLFLRAFPATATTTPSLPMHGRPIRLWPAAAPIDGAFEVSFPAPAGIARPERVGIYRDAGTYWTLLETKRDGDRLVAPAESLGAFAVLEDDRPPAIGDIVPKASIPPGEKRPKISASVSDIGSGVADVCVTCNGQWLLVAYDPENSRMDWERDEDLPDGPKEFVFTVTDKAGNTTSITHKVEVKAHEPPNPAAKKTAPTAQKSSTKKATPPAKAPKQAPKSKKP